MPMPCFYFLSCHHIYIHSCTHIMISACQMNNSQMRLFSLSDFSECCIYSCCVILTFSYIWRSPAMENLAVKRVMCCENWKTKIFRLSVGNCAINKIESGKTKNSVIFLKCKQGLSLQIKYCCKWDQI